jgi:signal transduction histidine kinase
VQIKHHLLFLGLLSLLLPITGWFALKSVDTEFRQSIEQASKNTLISLQASVQQILKSNDGIQLDGLVLGQLEDLAVNGYADEWNAIQAYEYTNLNHLLQVKIAKYNNDLALFITSNDNQVSINPVDLFKNDYVIVGLVNNRGLHQFKFFRQAEGLIRAERLSRDGPSYQAYWHETAGGYALEIKFENDASHHLGFANSNYIDEGADIKSTIAGTLEEGSQQDLKLLPIVSNNPKLTQIIKEITPDNNQFSITDSHNRLIYQVDKLPQNQNVSAWQWLITPIYQWVFGVNESNNNQWFYRQSDGMAGIQHSIAKNNINYSLKSMLPMGQQNMIQAFLKASIMMVAVVFLLMLAYLGYALVLAWRIKKLNQAMQKVLDESGQLHIQMPSHKAGDEIGQLSRGIESMLIEMREYTQYLKDLGSRLSHEMKTPLAIVQSSLDNLEYEYTPEFLERAQLGTKRLRFILNQLSELSQLKYTLEQTPKQNFDLAELVGELSQSYKSFIPILTTEIKHKSLMINGSAELLAQMIDKLMDNAKDFTSAKGSIVLSVIKNKENILLKIFNTDSQLPENGINIFDSLVSIRNGQDNNSIHLGLGLYLVQLISRFHQAKVHAENTQSPKGVVFTFVFKRIMLPG